MASDWQTKAFAEVIDFQEGPGILAKDFSDAGVPLIRLSGLDPGGSVLRGCNYLNPDLVERRYPHFKLAEGDILLSSSASLGRTAVVGTEAIGAVAYTGIIRMRPKNGSIVAPFIQYMLKSRSFQEQIEAMGVGSVIRHFGPLHLRQMTLDVPPLRDQQQILDLLTPIDSRVNALGTENGILEAIARAIFKSWFVDFDPVRAKAEGREPEGMDAATAALFTDRLSSSELGEIPEGWAVGTFGEVCQVVLDSVQKEAMGGNENYVGLEHIPRQSWSLLNWDKSEDVVSNKSLFRSGDTLFGKLRPYFHKVVVAPIDGLCSTDILVLRAEKSWETFMHCHASSEELIAYATRLSNGAKMPRTSWNDLNKYRIVAPPLGVVCAFESFVRPMIDRLPINVHQSRTLADLRDTLLPRLISGRLRIAEAEELVEAVL